MRITKETYIDTFIVIDKHTNIDRNTNKIETHINTHKEIKTYAYIKQQRPSDRHST